MPKKSSPWKKWVFFLIVIGLGYVAAKRFRGGEEERLEFKTAAASLGSIKQVVTASGSLEPVVNVEVGSQISGTLEAIYVDFNSTVTNQQPLARIDARSYENSLKQAKGELASADASLELAQINARRASELFSNNLISQSEHDTAMADLHRAEATKLIREASLDRASVDLSRTTVYSPIDGVVISRNVEVGQTVAASFNTPKLFGIANDLSEMHIHASVSEADIGGVTEGQKVQFTVDAFPTSPMSGLVHQVRNAAVTNQSVISYTTVIAVENSGSRLKPGMTANVEITLAERNDVLTLPNAAFRLRIPDGVEVIGKPASGSGGGPGGSGGSGGAVGGGGRRGGGGGGPGGGGPGGGGGDRRARMLEQFDKNGNGELDPDERAAMREMFQGQGGGRGGRGGRGGGGGRRAGNRPVEQTVYVLEAPAEGSAEAQPKLKAVSVRTGITDGAKTEVLSGLEDGAEVVIGTAVVGGAEGGSAAAANPFGPSFGRRGGGRR